MINRTVGFLGLLASIFALSSLIYGAFQEPLGLYMQGIMGGAMDVYRTMRDLLFSGIGWGLSGVVNWAGQWLAWLPPAPWWATMPSFVADVIIIAGLIFSAVRSFDATKTRIESAVNSPCERGKRRETAMSELEELPWELKFANKIYVLIFKKRLYFVEFDSPPKDEDKIIMISWSYRTREIILVFLGWYIFGSILFFLFAYGESQIGL